MYISRFLSQIVYQSQTTSEFLVAFLNMPCPTCPISFWTCKKNKLTLQWFDYEKGIGFTVWTKIRLRPSKAYMPCPTCPISFRTCKKNKLTLQWFDYEKGIGFTVWTKIRLRPSKAFLGIGRKAVYCQGA